MTLIRFHPIRYMILAVRTQILVYSTTTSLLVRSLRISEHDKITSYTICPANKNHLFVAAYSGLVLRWDWTTGQEIQQWKSADRLLHISGQRQDPENTLSSTFSLIHERPEHIRRVTSATFSDSSNSIVNENVVLENKSLASWMKVLDEGKLLVLYANNKLFLGEAAQKRKETTAEYVWREFTVPNRITSIDARSYSLSSSINKKRLAVDIVIGCQDGSILVYDDVLFKLTTKEKGRRENDIVSRRLHWHRNDVLSVKWSLDGNYIISGGSETVMVIWQLDTGHKQFLPHLSAAIRHLAISLTGSAYVVHLADNSVMVLSSSELQPTTYISGLVLRQRRSGERKAKRVPANFHHNDSNTLALAVPADYPLRSSAPANATLLQTYDIHAKRQSSRQALVRNNITALNVDPLGNPVQEPDVTHLKLSHDGKWLATVDEWTPPEDDMKPLYPAEDDLPRQGKEVFLKFWAKNETNGSWELVTKIENPHSTQITPSTSILDLQTKPHRSEFSTISAAGSINIWTPKARHRNGIPVKSQSGSQLYTWTLTHTLEIPLPFSLKTKTPPTSAAALEYSPCGSVLTISSNKSRQLHFVDTLSGHLLRYTQPGSYPGKFSRLAFLNHHLIAISKDLRVYNAVSGELLYALALDPSVPDVLLAANQQDGTFAVVCLLPAFMSKDKQGQKKPRSQIMVFDLKSATPLCKKIVDGSLEILQSLRGESGYLFINDEAEVVYLRRVGSSVAKTKIEVSLLEEEARARTGLEDVFGRGLDGRHAVNGRAIAEKEEEEIKRVPMMTHKTQSSLSDIFNRYSTNLPVRELFEQVARVFKGSSVA
jgi:NET1-associated nuclear protein 1 (U3 small nucleolar RNA-associated protein 17)